MGLFSDVLLTVDYDRTMTNVQNEIPPRNLEAIRYFMDNGGAFTLNTGRSFPMSKTCRETVPVNAPLLLYNGAAAYNMETGKMEFCHTIDLDMQETVRWCMDAFPELTVEVQGLEAHYCFEENWAWYNFRGHNHCARRFADVNEDLGPFLKFALYLPFRGETMADMYACTPEENDRVHQVERLLREKFGEKIEVFRPTARIMDVMASGVSKDRAARQLQQRLGRKILVCVGDGENDVPMLQGADFAVSPADGVVAVRFENVCPCGDGAVADVIYKKIPEILQNKA